MSVPVIAFFNNKGGVGKTTLVYHLSWAFADLERNILAVDLDPQANLTSSFLDDDQLEKLWPDDSHKKTVYGYVEPLVRGIGDIAESPYTIEIDQYLHLLPGDLDLSRFEDELSQQWPLCLDRKERAFRVISAFWRMMQRGALEVNAELILIDLGPNLGAINRSALVAADYLVIPLTPDLFSLQGLQNVGPTIRNWRKEWKERLSRNPVKDLKLPKGSIEPLGYIVLQHSVRSDRPVKAYERWVKRIPQVYYEEVVGSGIPFILLDDPDKNCLGLVKHYRSLMPMSMEAHKPMFHLLPADGAIGAHYHAVQEADKNFKQLAKEIEKRYKEKEKRFLPQSCKIS
jgi:cellulose biosynthesis protein BcsQ